MRENLVFSLALFSCEWYICNLYIWLKTEVFLQLKVCLFWIGCQLWAIGLYEYSGYLFIVREGILPCLTSGQCVACKSHLGHLGVKYHLGVWLSFWGQLILFSLRMCIKIFVEMLQYLFELMFLPCCIHQLNTSADTYSFQVCLHLVVSRQAYWRLATELFSDKICI